MRSPNRIHDHADEGEASPADVLERLLRERFSCRGFLPREVPRPVLERILTMAQRTASWCNAQPWQVIVTRGAATERFREALWRHASEGQPVEPDFAPPAQWSGPYKARRLECGLQLYDAVGIARGDRQASGAQARENYRLFGAPHAAIVTTEADLGVYGVLDCGGWLTSFMLAAQSLGVATIPQFSLAAYGPLVRSHFGIPENRRIVVGLSIGYADADAAANRFRTTRAALPEVVTWVDE